MADPILGWTDPPSSYDAERIRVQNIANAQARARIKVELRIIGHAIGAVVTTPDDEMTIRELKALHDMIGEALTKVMAINKLEVGK